MKLLIAAVGGASDRGVAAAIAEYEERARRYFDLEVIELPSRGRGSAPPGDPGERVRLEEGEELLRRLPENLQRFALTRRGKGMSSRALATHLEKLGTYGRPGAAFIIGGAWGLSEQVLASARYRLALSPMTLPHQLARLVLVEQLYRAGTIIRGEPYHKGSE